MAKDKRAGDVREGLAARREHSKGQGNFPSPRPHPGLEGERPQDRLPEELPKGRDPRTAPKGDVTTGQEDRNPDQVFDPEASGERRPS
jgi:hypothetical protein